MYEYKCDNLNINHNQRNSLPLLARGDRGETPRVSQTRWATLFADSLYCFGIVRRHEVYSCSFASKLATVLYFTTHSSFKKTATSAFLFKWKWRVIYACREENGIWSQVVCAIAKWCEQMCVITCKQGQSVAIPVWGQRSDEMSVFISKSKVAQRFFFCCCFFLGIRFESHLCIYLLLLILHVTLQVAGGIAVLLYCQGPLFAACWSEGKWEDRRLFSRCWQSGWCCELSPAPHTL